MDDGLERLLHKGNYKLSVSGYRIRGCPLSSPALLTQYIGADANHASGCFSVTSFHSSSDLHFCV